MKSSFVIFAGGPPRIAVVRGTDCTLPAAEPPNDGSTAAWAQAIRRLLGDNAYNGTGIMLALPSDWCLCATIPMADIPKRNRRPLLVYRFEEYLPAAAEELVIDFSIAAAEAMGVGVQIEKLATCISALEAEDIYVQSICPTLLLAAQEDVLGSNIGNASDVPARQEANGPRIVLWSDGPTYELIAIEGMHITHWTTWESIDAVKVQLRYLALRHPGPLTVCALDCNVETIHSIDGPTGLTVVRPSGLDTETLTIAAACGAGRILRGERTATIELRRDALAPPEPLRQVARPLSWAIAAMILFGLCLAGSLLIQAHAFANLTEQDEQARRSIYHEALGRTPVDANIRGRLASEERRLLAFSGATGTSEAGDLSRPPSALRMFDDALRAMRVVSPGMRFRILDMELSPDGLRLDGQVRNHGDADALADGLRSVGGYAVDPPHSEARSEGKGVSFTVTARLVQEPVKMSGAMRNPPMVAAGGTY